MLQDAINTFHALLTDESAQATHAQLATQLQRRGLYFGERPLMSVLRPRFLTPEQYRFLQERVPVILRAFDKIYRAAIADAGFRAQFGLYDWEESLITSDPAIEPTPVSRLDGFFVHDRGGFKITEYNAETPAGALYGDVLTDTVLGLPVMRDFLRRFELRQLPVRHHVLLALLDAHVRFNGGARGRLPRIAILDWPDVPTRHEFVLSADYFAAHGVECVIADPREAEFTGDRLTVRGQPIDVIYKRVLISELIERCGLDSAVVRAVRARAVCMVNSFNCKILHKKLSLAVLSDERNHTLLDAGEASSVEAHVPWTRRVAEVKTKFHGDVVDLLPFVSEHQERFVLKPNDEYGGKGIVLGWQVSASEWQQALRGALDEPFIVQERIDLPLEEYPVYVNGELRVEERIVDAAPFCFHGSYMDGVMSRLSTESLVNVTAGGGSSVPTVIVARR